jgi:hypothetical protein
VTLRNAEIRGARVRELLVVVALGGRAIVESDGSRANPKRLE